MKILVANDDGIRSPGLEHLVRMARNLGEVWVVAPSGQCSAMSQRISVFGTLDLQPVPDYPVEGVQAWTVSGSPGGLRQGGPGLCHARKAGPGLFGHQPGHNVGTDILYSGTIGVTMEAPGQRYPGHGLLHRKQGRTCGWRTPGCCPWWGTAGTAHPPLGGVEPELPSCDPDCLRGVLYDRFPSAMQFYHNRYTPRTLARGRQPPDPVERPLRRSGTRQRHAGGV